jgi:hypothetical protein
VRDSTDTTQKAPGRSIRRGSLWSSPRCARLRSLLRRGAVERPAPFSPTRFAGPTSVGGGPAGSASGLPVTVGATPRPVGLGSRQPTRLVRRVVHPGSSAVARARDVREGGRRARATSPRAKRVERSETRSVSPAAEAGEGRGSGAVRGGAVQSRYGSHVVCSHVDVTAQSHYESSRVACSHTWTLTASTQTKQKPEDTPSLRALRGRPLWSGRRPPRCVRS